MDDEGALEALNSNDFAAAVTQLEGAARETNYSSDIINHAYTLALYRTGQKAQLADIAFRIGSSMVNKDPASAMDYFQRAMLVGLDSARIRTIGEVHEEWCSRRATRPPGLVSHVAHVVGCLTPIDPVTQYLKMLVASLKLIGVESTIFTSESAASWFFNPPGIPQSQAVDIGARIVVAEVDGNFIERSEKIAVAIRAAGIPVAFFHGNLTEQISARVAAFGPAAFQINVNHGSEMDADLFDGYIHLSRKAMEGTRFGSRPAECIPPVSDAGERLLVTVPLTRQSMGLELAISVSATFGNMDDVSGSGYLKALTELMKRSPGHFHLFAGAGDVKAIRGFLHAQGVLPRIRFLGAMPEVLPLFGLVDVYLAAFPHSSAHSILEAMAAGKPVVGANELTGSNEREYIEIADRLIRTPALRAKLGQEMKDRFKQEFRPEILGKRYMDFVKRLHPEGVQRD